MHVVYPPPQVGPWEALHPQALSPPRSLPSSWPRDWWEPQRAGSAFLFAGGWKCSLSLFMLSVCEKVSYFSFRTDLL